MRKRLFTAAVVAAIVAFTAPAFSQEVDSGVEIYIEKTGSSSVYEGGINIEVEGEGISSLLLKHTKLPGPITILQNTAGFDYIEFERGEEWTDFTKLIPNGSYQLTIIQGGLAVNRPFVVDYSLMPSLPNISNPSDGQVLPSPSLVVTWDSAPAGIDGIYLNIESEKDLDTGYLPPTATYFMIPDGILEPGKSYGLRLEFLKGGSGMLFSSYHQIEFSIAP